MVTDEEGGMINCDRIGDKIEVVPEVDEAEKSEANDDPDSVRPK